MIWSLKKLWFLVSGMNFVSHQNSRFVPVAGMASRCRSDQLPKSVEATLLQLSVHSRGKLIAKLEQVFMKHHAPNICLPLLKDNLETRCQSRKRGIVQSNFYGNLPKIPQVIYTLDTKCVPNIMILAHAVLQIFCWQGSIGLQCVSWKRELIQLNIYRILSKVNQIIYTLDKICVPNIMVLAQAGSGYFVDTVP